MSAYICKYVNSYPVTSMRYAIQNLSTSFFGGPPDIAVAGPNVGSNLGLVTQASGTVGAATEAVKEGVPAIAFSGTTGSQTVCTLRPSRAEMLQSRRSLEWRRFVPVRDTC